MKILFIEIDGHTVVIEHEEGQSNIYLNDILVCSTDIPEELDLIAESISVSLQILKGSNLLKMRDG